MAGVIDETKPAAVVNQVAGAVEGEGQQIRRISSLPVNTGHAISTRSTVGSMLGVKERSKPGMAKWQRDGSWYTQGAEIFDETSSDGSDYATDEEEKLKFQEWRRNAEATTKQVYRPDKSALPRSIGPPQPLHNPKPETRNSEAPPEEDNDGSQLLWNPTQAKYQLMEISQRKDKVMKRLQVVNRKAHTFKRLLREAQDHAAALKAENTSLRSSISKVCNEMAALDQEHHVACQPEEYPS